MEYLQIYMCNKVTISFWLEEVGRKGEIEVYETKFVFNLLLLISV